MSTSGANAVDHITQDLACPKCSYNLRGLRGAEVMCPECGVRVDVVRLVRERWTRPWYKAPGLNTLVGPAGVAASWLLGLPIVRVVGRDAWVETSFSLLLLVLWLWLMVRTYRLFRSVEGPALAMAVHVILAAYVLLVCTCLVAGTVLVLSLLDQNLNSAGVAGVALFVTAGLFWLTRQAEKLIAFRCIGRYLRSITLPDP